MEKKNFATYEYVTRTAKANKQTEEIDLREAFGWEVTETVPNLTGGVNISFKRDRKINHKAELNRLERKADTIQKTIEGLERNKKKSASIFSYTFGSVASLVLGGGMCLCMLVGGVAAMIGGIALGAVGIAAMSINYPIYKRIVDKKSEKLMPVIEDNEERLAVVCEQAHDLLTTESL